MTYSAQLLIRTWFFSVLLYAIGLGALATARPSVLIAGLAPSLIAMICISVLRLPKTDSVGDHAATAAVLFAAFMTHFLFFRFGADPFLPLLQNLSHIDTFVSLFAAYGTLVTLGALFGAFPCFIIAWGIMWFNGRRAFPRGRTSALY